MNRLKPTSSPLLQNIKHDASSGPCILHFLECIDYDFEILLVYKVKESFRRPRWPASSRIKLEFGRPHLVHKCQTGDIQRLGDLRGGNLRVTSSVTRNRGERSERTKEIGLPRSAKTMDSAIALEHVKESLMDRCMPCDIGVSAPLGEVKSAG